MIFNRLKLAVDRVIAAFSVAVMLGSGCMRSLASI